MKTSIAQVAWVQIPNANLIVGTVPQWIVRRMVRQMSLSNIITTTINDLTIIILLLLLRVIE